VSGIDFRQARQEVRLREVLALLGYQPRQRGGEQLRGPCPVHGSRSATSRCFAAHLGKNVWPCFRCGARGHALDLWAVVTQQGIYQAVRDLYRRRGRAAPRQRTRGPES
jgi:CHC2 zinc finger